VLALLKGWRIPGFNANMDGPGLGGDDIGGPPQGVMEWGRHRPVAQGRRVDIRRVFETNSIWYTFRVRI